MNQISRATVADFFQLKDFYFCDATKTLFRKRAGSDVTGHVFEVMSFNGPDIRIARMSSVVPFDIDSHLHLLTDEYREFVITNWF